MITVECVGQLKDELICNYIKNIYKNDKILGNFSEEFGSVALKVLDDKINKGDKFKIRVLDLQNNIIGENDFTFVSIEGGSLIYEG